jgi:hypothetical protein
LRRLFVIVAVAAIYTAALIYRTPFWAFVAINLAVLILLIATVGVWLQYLTRAFWLPFCIVGWFYLAVAFTPATITRLANYLPSGQIVKLVDPEMNDAIEMIATQSPQIPVGFTFGPNDPEFANFELIMEFQRFADTVDTVSAVTLAAAAGLMASYCVRRFKATER